jgi:predicted flavoprotein YhiN
MSLPPENNYRVIFMERALSEVVSSQAEMIRRRGTSGPAVSEAALITALQKHLNQVSAWLRGKPDIRVCRVRYHQALRDPSGVSETLQRFLQRDLQLESMAQQVDQSLYRCRVKDDDAG